MELLLKHGADIEAKNKVRIHRTRIDFLGNAVDLVQKFSIFVPFSRSLVLLDFVTDFNAQSGVG